MRCEQCGREIRNAEMWQLTDRNMTPTPRTMRTLCRQCRHASAQGSTQGPRNGILVEAYEVVERYRAANDA
jgi:hypothetical protein